MTKYSILTKVVTDDNNIYTDHTSLDDALVMVLNNIFMISENTLDSVIVEPTTKKFKILPSYNEFMNNTSTAVNKFVEALGQLEFNRITDDLPYSNLIEMIIDTGFTFTYTTPEPASDKDELYFKLIKNDNTLVTEVNIGGSSPVLFMANIKPDVMKNTMITFVRALCESLADKEWDELTYDDIDECYAAFGYDYDLSNTLHQLQINGTSDLQAFIGL